MSLRDLEMSIVEEARGVLGKSKLRLKDLMEWRTTEFKPQDGETYVYLPEAKNYASFLIAAPKNK